MKGELSVDPTFKTLSIRKPVLHQVQPLVAFDGHKLHLNNKSIPWESKGIINSTFVSSLGVLMVLCNDWKLYVYNKNLDLIAKLSDWESRYSVGFQYIQKMNMLLLVGVIEIETMKVNLRTNIKETKFLSSVKFNIERKQLKSVQEKNRLSWNKGYGYDLAEDILYVWSTQNINFYSLSKLQIRSSIAKLVKKETAITYVHFNNSYKYTITGLMNGNVKVWRLPLSQVSASENIMIHNCIYHTKHVEKIIPSNDNRVIISSANDLTICLWSLQTFELLRVYNFEGEYSEITLVDYKRAFAIQNNQLGELTFGKTMEFITQIDSNISFYDKKKNDRGMINSFEITLQSNVGFQIIGKDLVKKDLNKIDIAYFYPPLKAQSIKQVLSCPYIPELYYMLVENGELFSVKIENNSSKIIESFSLQHIQDSQNHSLNQYPTFISFFDICDIEFDSQITENSLSTRKKQHEQSTDKTSFALKLMTVGCSKGSIIVISLDNMQRIKARLTYHRENILSIKLIKKQQQNIYILASHCAEDYLRLTSLQHDKAHCFLTIFCDNSLKFCISFDDKLALVFKKGIFELSKVKSSTQLTIWQNLDAINHQGEIFSLDYDPSKRLIMTSGSDNRIKIWSLLKVLIFQIKLDEGLKYTIWSNNLEILVLHRNKLLYLRDMHIENQDTEDQNTQSLESDRRFSEIDIKFQFLMLKKQHQKRKQSQKTIKDPQLFYQTEIKRKTRSQIQQKKNDLTSKRQIDIKSNSIIREQVKQSPVVRKKGRSQKKTVPAYITSHKAQEELKKKNQLQTNAKAARKHIEELNNLKKQINQSLLPKIQPKNEDKFQQFINAKLISKKMLTRRDITLNRIIMKNLIKQQFSQEEDQVSSLKLDF